MSEDIAHGLRKADLVNLIYILMPDLFKRRAPDWALVAAACQVLGHTGCGQALWPLGRLAADGISNQAVPDNVREEADRAAKSIQARMRSSALDDMLLRAATPSDDTTSLLRPATRGDVPAEQLLRRHDDEPPRSY